MDIKVALNFIEPHAFDDIERIFLPVDNTGLKGGVKLGQMAGVMAEAPRASNWVKRIFEFMTRNRCSSKLSGLVISLFEVKRLAAIGPDIKRNETLVGKGVQNSFAE